MVQEPDNIVLVYLRRIDEKVDRVREDVPAAASGR